MSAEIPSAGRYEIVEKIGAGGMGSVYRANDPVLGRAVAVKAIVFNDVADPKERRDMQIRTAREARSAGMLSHPNIVTIHDIGHEGGVAYIVMELVDGPTLWELFCRKGKLGKTELLSILKQSAAALDYAHAHGVIHRDVKPSNILVRPDGVTKLTDFGVAKILAAEQLTRTGLVVGTPNYMAPEQVKEQNVSAASDQFGLAVIAYELLTGRKPFDGGTFSSLLYKIMAEPAPPAREINPAIPQAVADVIERALAKEPERRFADCAAFAAALETASAEMAEDALGERYQRESEEPHEPEAREEDTVVPKLSLDQLRKVETSTKAMPFAMSPAPAAAPAPGRDGGKTLWIAGAAALLLILLIGAMYLGGGSTREAPAEPDEPMVLAENQPPAAPAPSPPEPAPPTAAPTPAAAPPSAAAPSPKSAVPAAPPPSAGQPPISETPLLVGATTTIVWRGQLDPGAELRIDGDRVSIGEISRGLPGEPVQIEVSPNVLEVLERPSAENNWSRLRLRNGEDRARRYFLIRCRSM